MHYPEKKISPWAWSNCKPSEVQKLQSDNVPLRKVGVSTYRTSKFLHYFNSEELVFKIVRGFFDISICCFAIFLSSLKNGISSLFDILGVLWSNFKAIRKAFYNLLIYSKQTPLRKKEAGFFASKFWMGNHKWINVSIWANAHLYLPLTERWPWLLISWLLLGRWRGRCSVVHIISWLYPSNNNVRSRNRTSAFQTRVWNK